tara:strand:+ start:1154 stop:3178 length:2025 start_codon:yes stop_codon:yes gene_type:complete
MENNNFRGIPTSLFLNGPELEIVTNPQNTSDITGIATFTGIATATGQIDGGSIAFQWYYDGSLVSNSDNINIVNFDTATGTGSSITISDISTENDDGKSVYFVADYIPSAYFEAGIAKSTANAFNEPLTSSVASIGVLPQISINTQPTAATVATDNSATFSIEGSILPNTYSLSYQWQLDGQDLPASGNFTSGGNTFVIDGGLSDTLTISSTAITTGTIRCKLTPVDRSLPEVISDEVTLTITSPRNILNIEQYDYGNSSATLTSHNLANGTLTLNNASYPGNDICIYAPEKDIEVEIDMHGGKGIDVESSDLFGGGDGGYSKIRFTMNKNEEYVLTGLFSTINAPFLYRKSSLIAVVGCGGESIREGAITGGAGGGIGIAGEDAGINAGGIAYQAGQLPENGVFSAMVPQETAIAPDGWVDGNAGGRVRPCTRGVYWREQGKAPCEDLGTIKFRTPDGTELSNTAQIDRGYKSGYNVIQTKGRGTPVNAGRGEGGAGAVGGNGGSNTAGEAGGGSGYTDGSVEVLSTQLGGSQYNNATIIISQLTPVSITQDIVDNRGSTNEINPLSITRYITPGLSGTEGHPVGSILYTVNILDYINPTLTARVLNTSLRGSGLTDPNNSIAVSAGYPRMVSANTFEVAFDMISSQNANERQATFVRNFELTMTANVSDFGS